MLSSLVSLWLKSEPGKKTFRYLSVNQWVHLGRTFRHSFQSFGGYSSIAEVMMWKNRIAHNLDALFIKPN